MTPGRILWQCRRCKEVLALAVSDIYESLRMSMKDETELRQMIRVHSCGYGGLGIADLIGATETTQGEESGSGI